MPQHAPKQKKDAQDLEQIFRRLKVLIKRHRAGLAAYDELPNSTAKEKKPSYGLAGKKAVSLVPGRKAQPTHVVGVIQQKHFVGFYSMPMYSHPKQIFPEHPDLVKARKGKSCLNITRLSPEILAELDRHITRGIALYKKEGWI
jgi:hypothetical protein